jgi:excinuclease ABC subunit A
MTVEEALQFFGALPKLQRPLAALVDVGLGYLKLGQPSTTLSGGEAQRIKLATELQRPATGRTLYLLDEPTTGLHFADVHRLVDCLQRLVDGGNTVLVIEHNLDVVRCADHLIELGPDGGSGGGRLVAEGTPEAVAKVDASPTGKALRGEYEIPRSASRSRERRAPQTHIEIRGARQNNLRDVTTRIPLDRFTVVTGPSGSGKSSLAFETLFREGQRRFIESMSTYARRFLGRMDRADVDGIDGLGPAIAIDQRASHRSPRSTVATSTEIQDYLRLLYARVGRPHCPTHGQELVLHSPTKIANESIAAFEGQKGYVLAPLRIPAEVFADTAQRTTFVDGHRVPWKEAGFVRALVDGVECRLDAPLPTPKAADGVALVVDRVTFRDRGRLVDAVVQAAERAGGLVVVRTVDGEQRIWSTDRSCPLCGFTVPAQPHPRYFSFNHHSGACHDCGGLGERTACDVDRFVNHPDKPLFDGAIQHKGAAFTFLTRKDGWYASVAKVVAAEHGIDLDKPFRKLSAKHRALLLEGVPGRTFEVVFHKREGGSKRTWRLNVPWKGLARQVEEWFHSPTAEHSPEQLRPILRTQVCSTCEGDRLQLAQRHVRVGGKSLPEFTRATVDTALATVTTLKLRKGDQAIAAETLKEVRGRLTFLRDVGLGYLTLDRSAATLSGGEAQRIRLATQLGNRLVGVLYVLDEPTVGLHPSDTERLLRTLLELRDLGNTVVAVEHDEHVIRAADHVLDLGPGAGRHGGRIVAAGTPAAVAAGDSLTGRYLRGAETIAVPSRRREPIGRIELRGVTHHNLRALDVDVPLGSFVAVTGVSGSGKSTLVMDVLKPMLEARTARPIGVGDWQLVVVDQSPIGTTPSSNPATYTGILTPIRELFAKAPLAVTKGFGPGRFSFNVSGGRCEACEGKGQLQVEMHFLADVWIECETCRGKRFNQETLAVTWRGKSIADVFAMEVVEAAEFFANHRRIVTPLRLLADVGLGYLRLGQSADTLSGGEAQRIKLVGQLAKPPRAHTIYLLDEPTTGLHVDDVRKLVDVLQRLVERGDSVLTIEHHPDVVKCADHVLELGPGAGPEGGKLVASGTPEQVAAVPTSPTGRFLRPLLKIDDGRRPKSIATEAR